MRSGNEFKEDHGVHRDVTTRGRANDGPEKAYSFEIAEPSDRSSEDAADENGCVKRGLPTNEVGRDTPESGTNLGITSDESVSVYAKEFHGKRVKSSSLELCMVAAWFDIFSPFDLLTISPT